ncbi:MAG TPA: alpha/beta hydrolase, partial [Capillimicrobium sp.]
TPDGVRLRYTDRGAGDDAIVLVHGWKGSHRLWDQVVARLEPRHRVVAFDLRGMGESDKPKGRYDFDELSDDLAFVLGELGLRDVTLVGWSMGCTVSLRHMERGGAGVARLVLLNGPLRLVRTDDFPEAMSAEQLDGYLEDLAANWPASERAFQAEAHLDPDGELAEWAYRIALQTPLPIALQVVREQARLDMREAVRGLRVPVLAAYSTRDPYYPVSLGEWIARTAPDGRLAVFEGSAHGTPVEEPAALADAIEAFVSATPAGARA